MALETFFKFANRPGVEQVRQNQIQAQLDRKMANEAAQRNAIAELLKNQNQQILNRRNQLANTKTAMEMANFGNDTFGNPVQLQDGSYGQPVYDREGKFVRFQAMPGYTPKAKAPQFSNKTREAMDLAEMEGLTGAERTKFILDYLKTGSKSKSSTELDPVKRQQFIDNQVYKFENLKGKIDDAIGILDDDQGSFLKTTSGPGSLAKIVPGTEGFDLQATIDTIQANLAFDRLQEMRDASKTGGALGSVSERELNLLQSSVESLQVGQSPERLRENLAKVKRHYQRFINALEAERAMLQEEEALTAPAGSSPAPSATPATPATPPATTERLEYDPVSGELKPAS